MHTPKGNPQLKLQPMDLNLLLQRTAVDQIIDIHTTLRYLGVPIRDKSYMFGDNRSVCHQLYHSQLHHLQKTHIWHPIIESGKQLQPNSSHSHWKDGKSNPADILSKHWEFATVWPIAQAYPVLVGRDCHPAEGE